MSSLDTSREDAPVQATDEKPPAGTIMPTVGSDVWFYPHPDEHGLAPTHSPDEPLSAHISGVIGPTEVNLTVFAHDGTVYPRPHVFMRQGDEDPPEDAAYCEWMVEERGSSSGNGGGGSSSGKGKRRKKKS
jgi:hypothetical protein